MARQNRYANDTSIQGADRLTGIRSEDGRTANFTIEDVANYLAETGNADGSRLGFKYDVGGKYVANTTSLPKGRIYFGYPSDTAAADEGFPTITHLYFNNTSEDGADIVPIRGLLNGAIIKLTNTSTAGSRGYGLYRVISASTLAGSNNSATEISLSFIGRSGEIGDGNVTLSYFQGASTSGGTGVAVRSGTEDPRTDNVFGNQGDFYIQFEIREGVDTPIRFFGPKTEGSGITGWGDGAFFQGEQGEVGPEGPRGPQGQRGETGPQGVQGEQGPRGDTGAQGPQGATGSQGSQGDPGPAGERGPQGLQGNTGPQGIQGVRGLQGRTIYNSTGTPIESLGDVGDFYIDTTNERLYGPKTSNWTDNGFVSLIGPAGPTGAQGPAGTDGADGADGADGVRGRTVLNGTSDPGDAIGGNGDFFVNTATNEIFGPKDESASPTMQWGTGTSLVGPAGAGTIEVSHDGTSIGTGFDHINFEGSGVTLVRDEGSNEVLVRIAGGGAGTPAEISEISSFTQSGFVSNTWRTTDQSIDFRVQWTPVTDTAPVRLAITNNGGLTNPTDITTVATLDGDVTFPTHDITATLPAGEVRWTATLTYTDGDGTSRTLSRNLNLTLNKTLPTLTFGAPTFNTFAFATQMAANTQQEVEAYDAGNIVYGTPTQTNASWTRTTTDPTFAVTGTAATLTAPSTIAVAAGDRNTNALITGTQEYDAVGTEDATATDSERWDRIISFRYGSVESATAPVWTNTGASTIFDMRNFTAFTGTRRTIDFGNQAPNTTITVTSNAGEWIYFVFSSGFTPTSISTNSPSVNYLNHVGTDPDAAFIRRNTAGSYVIYTLLRETLYDGTSLTFNIN